MLLLTYCLTPKMAETDKIGTNIPICPSMHYPCTIHA